MFSSANSLSTARMMIVWLPFLTKLNLVATYLKYFLKGIDTSLVIEHDDELSNLDYYQHYLSHQQSLFFSSDGRL